MIARSNSKSQPMDGTTLVKHSALELTSCRPTTATWTPAFVKTHCPSRHILISLKLRRTQAYIRGNPYTIHIPTGQVCLMTPDTCIHSPPKKITALSLIFSHLFTQVPPSHITCFAFTPVSCSALSPTLRPFIMLSSILPLPIQPTHQVFSSRSRIASTQISAFACTRTLQPATQPLRQPHPLTR